MFCTNCGEQSVGNNEFCTKCGENLSGNMAERSRIPVQSKPAIPKRISKPAIIGVSVFIIIVGFIAFQGLGGSSRHNIGDIIQFGYREWIVMDVESNGNIMVISYTFLDERTMHGNFDAHISGRNLNTTWETSDLRAWLNGDFYRTFTQEERARIVETTRQNPTISEWSLGGAPGGQATRDRVFLLSWYELDLYRNPDVHNQSSRDLKCWWLRSPANVRNQGLEFFTFSSGTDFSPVWSTRDVRPAMILRPE